jgi:hypothetical protein
LRELLLLSSVVKRVVFTKTVLNRPVLFSRSPEVWP